jgi:hypothetical protein
VLERVAAGILFTKYILLEYQVNAKRFLVCSITTTGSGNIFSHSKVPARGGQAKAPPSFKLRTGKCPAKRADKIGYIQAFFVS